MLLRIVINGVALGVAARLIDGFYVGDWTSLLVLAVVFGLVNAIIRPFLKLFTLPLLFLTLGLFTFVINALMLMLAVFLGKSFGLDAHVGGFFPAFLAALIVSFVSMVLSWMIPDQRRRGEEHDPTLR